MKTYLRSIALTALVTASAAGCKDFLSGGELSNDPNRPQVVTNRNIFVGIQSATWAEYNSDLSRLSGLFTQQLLGAQSQYIPLYQYAIDENATGGFHSALYGSGGLVDIRNLQQRSRDASDFRMLGVAQVMEGMLLGLGADYFGDLVYKGALQGGNPALTKQLEVYDSLQAVLDQGITNLASTAATNAGPGPADLVYGGSASRWTALAHSLKARLYLNTAEARPGAYAQALTEARLGIQTEAGDYHSVWSGRGGETNFFYQFVNEQRNGYAQPNEFLWNLMQARSDPRRSVYFAGAVDPDVGTQVDFGDVDDPTYPQQIFSADENTLIWAEAAYRTGNQVEALAQLNRYRTANGIASGAEVGPALLREILTEKYIELFIHPQAWTDYRRTCFPNVTPTVAGTKVPGRLFYDALERQTNPNIPSAQDQPTRNQADPANATDDFGNVCLGQ
ncbi:MAG: SusD/RagB family nutrient-binding outer membrane lipoprotein [Gemmatimonadaceae bacterium]